MISILKLYSEMDSQSPSVQTQSNGPWRPPGCTGKVYDVQLIEWLLHSRYPQYNFVASLHAVPIIQTGPADSERTPRPLKAVSRDEPSPSRSWSASQIQVP